MSLCSCGLSETRVTNNFDALPSSVLCQKMMDNDGLGFQLRIAGEIVSKRGDTCEGTLPSPKAEKSNVKVTVKQCKKSFGGGFWGGFARGMDGC